MQQVGWGRGDGGGVGGGGAAGTCVSGERRECTPSRQENTLAPVYCEQDRWKGGVGWWMGGGDRGRGIKRGRGVGER